MSSSEVVNVCFKHTFTFTCSHSHSSSLEFFPLSVPSLYVWALVSLLVISCFILLVYYYSHFVFRSASLVSSSGFSISCPLTCFLSPSLLSPSPLVRCHVLAHHCTFLVSLGDFSWLSSVLYFVLPFWMTNIKAEFKFISASWVLRLGLDPVCHIATS